MGTGDERPRRRDPRAEPSEPPPERVIPAVRDPRAEPETEPPPSKTVEKVEKAPSEPPVQLVTDLAPVPSEQLPPKPKSEPPPPSAPRPKVSARDSRLEEIEPLLASSSWDAICKKLGPPDQAGKLPPTLGLIYALARREVAGDASAGDANQLAIRCVAAMFDVGHDSATAMVVAKRLLRRNPAAWRTAPAPPKNVSIIIMILAVVIGAAVGWYLSNSGRLPFKL